MKKFLLFFILFVVLIIPIVYIIINLYRGSYGFFSLIINSTKNINFKILSSHSNIPENLNIYINNSLVDISQNSSCLYTANTNTVDIISFFWEWPVKNTDTFYNSTLSLNLQIFFERN